MRVKHKHTHRASEVCKALNHCSLLSSKMTFGRVVKALASAAGLSLCDFVYVHVECLCSAAGGAKVLD